MIKLKLAEYDLKTGKFKKFHNLERFGFVYGGDFINFDGCHMYSDIDEKDPLNRFDGLFDGRTYGAGQFVLIKDNLDDVYKTEGKSIGSTFEKEYRETFNIFEVEKGELEEYLTAYRPTKKVVGNLHDNPKLWNKIGTTEDHIFIYWDTQPILVTDPEAIKKIKYI